jgi:GDSL-like Lipase/Acylhydrolase family
MRRKLLLAAVSALLTLLLGEAALRLLGYGAGGRGTAWYAGGNHPRFLFQPAPDPHQGYTLRPNFRGWQVAPGREFAVPAVVDARGLRDHRHTAPPRPLVLAIGDSMTFGEGVPVEQTFAALLERSTGARVVNAGVPGYGSPQMLARFEQLSATLHPDLVLVTLSPLWDRNRCAEPFVYQEGFLVSQGYAGRLFLVDGNLVLGEVRWPLLGPATAWAKEHSALARLALPALRDLLTRRSPARGGVGAGSAAGVEPSAQALAALHAAARHQGAELRVILIESRGPAHQADRRALEQALRRHGVPVTALDRLLAKADWKRLRYPRDQHWNAAGHRVVAAALAPLVRGALAGRRRGEAGVARD